MAKSKSFIGKLFNQNTPVAFAPRGVIMQNAFPRQSRETDLRAMGMLGDVFSIITLLASATSAVTWHLYRKNPTDGRRTFAPPSQPNSPLATDDRQEVLRHQALKVWNKPNNFYTNRMFVEGYRQHMELVGEGIWVLDYAGLTFPVAMWYVTPSRIEPVPSPETFIAGYVYTSPTGEQVPLQPNEVIMLKRPCPWDPYHGLGPVQALMVDIQNARYTAEWNRNFWYNNATPGGIIEVPTSWDDTDFNKFTDRWRETHRGYTAAGRVGVLEGGAKWVDAQPHMRDMQGAELRQISAKVIRRAWGIHPSMIGDVEDVNRANALTSRESFGRDLVVPRLDDTRDVLNNFFLPLFYPTPESVDVEFDYENPVPEDREAQNQELRWKSSAISILVAAGYDPEAVLEAVGFPSMPFVGAPPNLSPAEPASEPDDEGESIQEEDSEIDQEEVANIIRRALQSSALQHSALQNGHGKVNRLELTR